MGPRDFQCTTWYLNKTRLRTWDHFPRWLRVEEKELRTKKGKKGRAGWIPKLEDAKLEFQEIALYPGDGRDGMEVAALQERLEEAAAAVKATTTAIRN